MGEFICYVGGVNLNVWGWNIDRNCIFICLSLHGIMVMVLYWYRVIYCNDEVYDLCMIFMYGICIYVAICNLYCMRLVVYNDVLN